MEGLKVSPKYSQIALPVSAQAVDSPAQVSAEELENWMSELSNWGRWGEDDELGTLNLITPEKSRKAAALVDSLLSEMVYWYNQELPSLKIASLLYQDKNIPDNYRSRTGS